MKHETVLKEESIQYLNIKKNGIYVDATLGGGGHSEAILEKLDGGTLYAFDQDQFAIEYAKERLKNYHNVVYIESNFKNIKSKLDSYGIHQVDGIMMDLGMSSFQIDDQSRGFSYLSDAILDMRMNQNQALTAQEVVNTYTYEALVELFFMYGDEKNAKPIAREIIKRRPLTTTQDLVAITDKINKQTKGHSAKRVFQALRIEVNDEMGALKKVLEEGFSLLKPGGRMVCLTFHSLEDRMVKHFFKEKGEKPWPKGVPMTGVLEGDLNILTKKPVLPSEEEYQANSRSRSAQLRAVEKR